MKTKPKLSNLDKARAVREYAQQCNGSETFYRHAFQRVLYTQGVHFLAETCGAHWLIDAIVSHQLEAKVKAEEFQLWTLKQRTMDTNDALLVCEDGNGNLIAQQVIEYTDFPRELMPFNLYLEAGAIPAPGSSGGLVNGQTLMLPEER